MLHLAEEVSVRDIVEFIMRSGDLDPGAGSLAELDAMQEGQKLHRKIQKEGGAGYKAEVPLRHVSELDGLVLTVSGRADGVITEVRMAEDESHELSLRETVAIDEIKCTYRDLASMEDAVPVHRAQALCYAYFYACDHDLAEIDVQNTYVSFDKHTVRRFRETWTREKLAGWYQDLIEKYAAWIRMRAQWIQTRDASIEACRFPFSFRKGQKRMMAGVYRTIEQKKVLFALAPTGTGKTIAALYPSIKALGEGKAERIFYLTARTIARTVAEDTCGLLQDRGLKLKVITLTAKDKICIADRAVCNPALCERARGHFDRVNEALWELVTKEDRLTRTCIESYAERYQVCPFELQLDASLFCDTIIGDYNYVFDPDVYLKRFFGSGGDYVFLVDEAHNLVERARSMYSAQLPLAQVKADAKHLKGLGKKFSGRLSRLISALEVLRDESDAPFETVSSIASLEVRIMQMQEVCQELLRKRVDETKRDWLQDLFFLLRKFENAFERMDDRYAIYLKREGKNCTVTIFCMNPSKDVRSRLDQGRSAIFFSATMLPVGYYKDMLSSRDDYDLYIDSPFDPANRLIIAATDVSTRYTRRNEQEYIRYAGYIRQIIRARHGNYMVFFPSYKLMEDVFDVFCEQELSKAGSGLHVVKQTAGMSEEERQAFLDQFRSGSEAVIGFCVMGGIFAEGIDLRSDRLIGAIIVGTGLPQISEERQLLRDYFDRLCGRGFEYAYLNPGINKVLQAGGRVIRTETDQGVIALLDERFCCAQYRSRFPRDWTGIRRTNLGTAGKIVEDFWTDKDS